MSSETAIRVRNVTKNYNIYEKPVHRLLQGMFRGRKSFCKTFTALKDVSFEVKKGETIGIIGRNGAGKSTLLEIICGTVAPTSGEVEVNGRVAALLELGAGFNREFTGKENIYMNATLIGMSREEIEERYDDIVAFADIGEFIDQPVKTYSSGMYVRLAFAVAINADPDILIVDEALAVGDSAFQRKCYARIQEIQQKGGVILFVSHSVSAILELCGRAILLDQGELILSGAPKTVVSYYEKLIYAPVDKLEKIRGEILSHQHTDDTKPRSIEQIDESAAALLEEEKPAGIFDPAMKPGSSVKYESRGAVIENVRIETLENEPVNMLSTGKEYFFKYDALFTKEAYSVRFGMLIKTVNGVEIGGLYSHPSSGGIESVPAETKIEVKFKFKCVFNPDDYFYNAGISGISDGEWSILHRITDAGMFTVRPETGLLSTGMVDILAKESCHQKETDRWQGINLYGKILSKEEIAGDYHREYVGGMWETIGKLQFDFAVAQGLKPEMNLIDIGCGSLRGGLHFINYLKPGNYYGLDTNRSLLEAGYQKELVSANLQDRLPKENLLEESKFRASRFRTKFDFAIAISVFTHLPANNIRICLLELSKCIKTNGKFFATYFECSSDSPIENALEYFDGFKTYPDRDPYHYKYNDFKWLIEGVPWEITNLGDWGHPKNQKMLCFTRK